MPIGVREGTTVGVAVGADAMGVKVGRGVNVRIAGGLAGCGGVAVVEEELHPVDSSPAMTTSTRGASAPILPRCVRNLIFASSPSFRL
jgi:hypothetical protein